MLRNNAQAEKGESLEALGEFNDDSPGRDTVKVKKAIYKNATAQRVFIVTALLVFIFFLYRHFYTTPVHVPIYHVPVPTVTPGAPVAPVAPVAPAPAVAPVPAAPEPAAPEATANKDTNKWPKEWLKNFSPAQLEESAQEGDKWRLKALKAMEHAYVDGYRRAYGHDTVDPQSGRPGKTWGDGAYTMVDSLSTLWLMDMHSEFNAAAEWIDKNLNFEYTGMVSVFETIIREMGGLLSAYALSKNEIFKRKAQLLGEKLMPAFQNVVPKAQISLGTGQAANSWFGDNILLAEAGTLQIEFRYLSHITGDPKYKNKGDAAMDYILNNGGSEGMVPWGFANGRSRSGPVNTHITFGAMGDSYYEYLLKMYIQGGKRKEDQRFLDAWKISVKQMEERLVRRHGNEYAAVLQELSRGSLRDQMDHLTCFVGGMLVLADNVLQDGDKSGYNSLGRNVTAGCYEMYLQAKSGVSPDTYRWKRTNGDADGKLVAENLQNDLRPETAESIFYLFYFTGDPKYRRMAGRILDAFEKQCHCPYGYCSLSNVNQDPAPQRAEMESFFLAETLKYLYLTFLPVPSEKLNLDDFVFNTEAHPLPVLHAPLEPGAT